MSLSDVRGDARDALHDEVRDRVHGGCFATRVVREDGEGIGGEGWDVHVRRGEDGAAPFAHLVELQALAFERQESLHRERRRAARRVDFVVVCVIAAVPPAGVAASEVAPGAGARAFGPRGRLGSDSSMPASPPARAPSPRPAGAPISRPDAATVNARPRRWGTLAAGAGGARGDGTEDEEGATRRAGEASFRGDPSVPRRKSVAAPTRWIERIKPRRYSAPGRCAFVRTAQLSVAGNRGGAGRSSGWLIDWSACVPIHAYFVPEQHRLDEVTSRSVARVAPAQPSARLSTDHRTSLPGRTDTPQ